MKKFAVTLLLFFLSSFPAYAAKVQEIKTPQGFTVWLVEEHALPIISVNISFTGSGLAYDPSGKEGRSNMVSALLLEGAGEHTSKAFNEVLEEHAVRLNIGTDDDTVYALLQTLSEHQNIAFSLLADALIRPRFDDDAISRTRMKMQALLLEQSAKPNYKLTEAFQQKLFGTHPYARMGFGSKETINALTVSDFRDYTARYLTRENILISVVGDVSPEEVSAMVDKYFAELPTKYTPDNTVNDIVVSLEPDQTVIAHDIPQSMVAFGANGLKRSDPDYIPAYVMNYILGGGGLNSLLASEIRVRRGLAYTVRSQLDPKAHTGIWRGMFATRNAEVKQALQALHEVLSQFAQQGTSPEILSDAKAYLTGSFVLDLSSNQEMASFLTMMQMHHLGSDYLEKRNRLIEQVSMKDIERVTRRIIDPKQLRVVIVGQPEL